MKASRTSSYLKAFLLISFTCAFIPLAYIIGRHIPSNACGPFKGLVPDFYTGMVVSLIEEWEWTLGRSFMLLLGKTPVLIGISTGSKTCLASRVQ